MQEKGVKVSSLIVALRETIESVCRVISVIFFWMHKCWSETAVTLDATTSYVTTVCTGKHH